MSPTDRLRLGWPRSCPRGRCPLSACLGALLHVSGTLLGSLPLKLWPGRGLPRSQSWWPILRRRALHPHTHEHLLEPVPPCLEAGLSLVPGVSGLKEDSSRPRPLAVTSHLVPGLGAGQLGVEGGTSGPSCAQPGQATPTHSALLPQSRLVRAWASFCLCAPGAEGSERDRSGGRRLGKDPLLGDSQPACLCSAHSWTQVLCPKQTTRVLSVLPSLPSRGRVCPLCAWQRRPRISWVPDGHALPPRPTPAHLVVRTSG